MSGPATSNTRPGSALLEGVIPGRSTERFTVVSMFSGCGGLDLGFCGGFAFGGKYYDRLPFDIAWANDNDAAARRTYEQNLKREVHVGDVESVVDTLPDSTDVVVGGFPCQDVSINGKDRGAGGKRSILYRYMIQAIEKVQPRVFVAENVKGLLQSHARSFFEQMLSEFESTGYRISHKLYLAADFGVPQMRERLFIVGTKDQVGFEHPSPGLNDVTAKEILSDLEEKPEIPVLAHVWSRAAASPEQDNRRLVADRPATTIRAEHHGNIQWHYHCDRRISLREAARLQSFPDNFPLIAECARRNDKSVTRFRQCSRGTSPKRSEHILNRSDFEQILDRTVEILTENLRSSPLYHSPDAFEQGVQDMLRVAAHDTDFTVSPTLHPQAFPDIRVNGFGVEAKYSKQDTWLAVGNSIFEGMREVVMD